MTPCMLFTPSKHLLHSLSWDSRVHVISRLHQITHFIQAPFYMFAFQRPFFLDLSLSQVQDPLRSSPRCVFRAHAQPSALAGTSDTFFHIKSCSVIYSSTPLFDLLTREGYTAPRRRLLGVEGSGRGFPCVNTRASFKPPKITINIQ